jgi:Domain of unknown function (DUF4936)
MPADPRRPVARHELYLYWRTPRATWRDAVAALAAWQTAFCADAPGLRARALRRVDDDAVSMTLMEIWSSDGGVDAATAQRIGDVGNAVLAPWLAGPRHVEVFAAD